MKSIAESVEKANKCAIQSCLAGLEPDVLHKFKDLHEKFLTQEKAEDHSGDESPEEDPVHVSYRVGPCHCQNHRYCSHIY